MNDISRLLLLPRKLYNKFCVQANCILTKKYARNKERKIAKVHCKLKRNLSELQIFARTINDCLGIFRVVICTSEKLARLHQDETILKQ